MTRKGDTYHGLREVFISPNESDRNGEPANVVDGLYAIARAIARLAQAIEATAKVGSKE
jgi:hypothetical protein